MSAAYKPIAWRRTADGCYTGAGYKIHPAPSGMTKWDPRTPDNGSLRAATKLRHAKLTCEYHRRGRQ